MRPLAICMGIVIAGVALLVSREARAQVGHACVANCGGGDNSSGSSSTYASDPEADARRAEEARREEERLEAEYQSVRAAWQRSVDRGEALEAILKAAKKVDDARQRRDAVRELLPLSGLRARPPLAMTRSKPILLDARPVPGLSVSVLRQEAATNASFRAAAQIDLRGFLDDPRKKLATYRDAYAAALRDAAVDAAARPVPGLATILKLKSQIESAKKDWETLRHLPENMVARLEEQTRNLGGNAPPPGATEAAEEEAKRVNQVTGEIVARRMPNPLKTWQKSVAGSAVERGAQEAADGAVNATKPR